MYKTKEITKMKNKDTVTFYVSTDEEMKLLDVCLVSSCKMEVDMIINALEDFVDMIKSKPEDFFIDFQESRAN